MSNQSSPYIYDISGDITGIFGDVKGGVVNQYIIAQKSKAEIHSQRLIKGSPYLGLNKFTSANKDKFFGRRQLIAELSEDLKQDKHNELLLLGASGSGKSSLVQAGIIPYLSDEMGTSKLVKLIFVPDKNPFESLYHSLPNNYKNAANEIINKENNDVLIKLIDEFKENSHQWIIFIDQFEEIFTITPQQKRKQFIANLVSLMKQQDSSVKLVIAMRSDFLDNLSKYGDFNNKLQRKQWHLSDLTESELRLAIAEPAAKNGVTFEQGLVEQIISDFYNRAGSLPLLQYTLDLLWDKDKDDLSDDNRVLNIKTYNDLGGVSGALQQRANYIYEKELEDEEKKAAEEIFIELIGLSDLTVKEPVSRRVEKSQFSNDHNVQSALDILIESRLLVSGREKENTVEVAHEELLRSWEFIQNLIRENQEFIILRNLLSYSVDRWDDFRKENQEKKAQGELWSSARLEQFDKLRNKKALKSFVSLDKKTELFIKESQKKNARELTRAKRTAAIGFTLAGLASVFGISAIIQQQEAQRQSIISITQTAEANLLLNNQLDAMVEAIEAKKELKKVWIGKDGVSLKVLGSLGQAIHHNQQGWKERLRLQGTDVIFSPDGKLLAVKDGKVVRILNTATGDVLQTLQGHQGWVSSVVFSPDGKRIATASDDNTARVWDTATGDVLQTLQGHQDWVSSVVFSPDGKQIATASDDNTARVWQVGDLEDMLSISCDWVRHYLASKPEGDGDRDLCEGVGNK